ncbi:MAG: site-specific integrase [Lachnospiraceae bacterium]|nr:site-specific integrase [Lachnospiraceae bacterium]
MKTIAAETRETLNRTAQTDAAPHDTKQSSHVTKQRMSVLTVWLTAVWSALAAHSIVHIGGPRLTRRDIDAFLLHLKGKGRSDATIDQYTRHLLKLQSWLDGRPVTPQRLIEWRTELSASYAVTSVNNFLSAVNSFISFKKSGNGHAPVWKSIDRIPALSAQTKIFCEKNRVLEKDVYEKLVQTAYKLGEKKIGAVMETICSLGIRVSELQFITVEAVQDGKAVISMKGKIREIRIPDKLAGKLLEYAQQNAVATGAVFITGNGKPVSRKWIWKKMKDIAAAAGVNPEKVFPHNLRHLFARCYYEKHKDIKKLADILGHSSLNTTRIYLMESGDKIAREIEELGLVA